MGNFFENKLTISNRLLITLFLVFGSCVSVSSFAYEYEFMDIDCRFHGPVNHHVVNIAIKLFGGEGDGSFSGTCTSILKSVKGVRLVLNVNQLEMPLNYYVEVRDGTNLTNPLLSSRMSGHEEDPERVFRSSGPYMRVDIYGTGLRSSDDGFAAHVTEFDDAEECGIDQYKCCSGECIGQEVRKDSYDNCPDNSDEWEVSSCLNAGAVAGIVLGSLAAAAILLCVGVYCCYVRQKKKNQARAPAASGSYPAQAPATGGYPAQAPGPGGYPTQPAVQFSYVQGPQVQMSGVGYNPGPPPPPGAYPPQPAHMYQAPPGNMAQPPPGYPGYPAAGYPTQPPAGIPAPLAPGAPPQPPTDNPSLPPPAYPAGPGPGQDGGAALPQEPDETRKPFLQK